MLYLVRHGQTPYNAEHRLQGQLDTRLSELGREQAHALGLKLKAEGARFDALYCSRLERAIMTASIIGSRIGLEPRVVPGLEEINFGCFQGHTYEEIAELYPEAYREFQLRGTDVNPHGGETGQMVFERARRALLSLPEAEKGSALVVSHGAVIGYLRAYIAGKGFSDVKEYIPRNAQTVEFGEREIALLDRDA